VRALERDLRVRTGGIPSDPRAARDHRLEQGELPVACRIHCRLEVGHPDGLEEFLLRKLGSEPEEAIQTLELDQGIGRLLAGGPGVVEEGPCDPLRVGVCGHALLLEQPHDPIQIALLADLQVLNDRGGVARESHTEEIFHRAVLVVPGAMGVAAIPTGLLGAGLLHTVDLDHAAHWSAPGRNLGRTRPPARPQRGRAARPIPGLI